MLKTRQEKRFQPDARFAHPNCLFFGIGSSKCGTTWLHDYLKSHPEVHVPKYFKELNYWYWRSEPRDKKIPWVLESLMPHGPFRSFIASVARPGKNLWRVRKNRSLRRWYKSYMVDSPSHSIYCDVLFSGYRKQRVAGEITPNYCLSNEQTFAEMDALAPDVRFIFIMRDPVSRLWSAARHGLRRDLGRDHETPERSAERMRALLERSDNHEVRFSSYDRTIETLENVVASDKIAYFFYETLFQQSEIDRLCAFLGVESFSASLDKKVNVGGDVSGNIPPELARQARQALAPTYDFCRAKFGTLPSEWQDNTLAGDS